MAKEAHTVPRSVVRYSPAFCSVTAKNENETSRRALARQRVCSEKAVGCAGDISRDGLHTKRPLRVKAFVLDDASALNGKPTRGRRDDRRLNRATSRAITADVPKAGDEESRTEREITPS